MTTPQFLTQAAPAGLAGKTFGIRAASYVIDALVQYGLVYVSGAIGGTVLAVLATMFLQRRLSFRNTATVASVLLDVLLSIGYFFVFEWLYGATPGKLITGMRVIKVDGSPCDAKAAIIRGLFRYVDGLIFALPAYFNMKAPLYQRLGDKSAKTIVVAHKQLKAAGQPRSWWWCAVAGVLYLGLSFGATICVLISLLV